MKEPRKPTAEELRQLHECVSERWGYDESQQDDITGLIEAACIAVFDRYVTDSPGFAGKVLLVLWNGAVGQYEAYTWKQGAIQYVPQVP